MFSGKFVQGALSALALFAIPSVQADVTTYCCDAAAEAAYLADLAGLASQPDLLQESFEEGPWGEARTVPQSSVSNLGVTWSRLDAYLSTSTGGGDVHDGSYIMFTWNMINGLPVHAIPDGYTLVADGSTLYGVGGWFTGNNTKLAFIVDGDPERVDFTGAEATVSDWRFLGFIETLGFGNLEIRAVDEVGDETRIFFSDDFTLALGAGTAPPPSGAVDLSGSVETADGTPLCAMVLASGQYMFSCDPDGSFSLTDLPRQNDGTVKRQVYVDGFFPNIEVLPDSVDETVVMTRAGACPSYSTPYDPGVFPDSAGQRIDISGSVLLQDTQTPICAMVLANGQYTFSCDGSGSYALNIPLDSSGQFKLQVYADGFAPNIQRFDEFSAINDVRMARAAECQ